MRWKYLKAWDEGVCWHEYECQAYACMRMNVMPWHGKSWSYAADMNGLADTAERLERAAALGLKPGEPDIRLNFRRFWSGRIVYVEIKMWDGEISDEQQARHTELRRQGFTVEVIWCRTPMDCFTQLKGIIMKNMRLPSWGFWCYAAGVAIVLVLFTALTLHNMPAIP